MRQQHLKAILFVVILLLTAFGGLYLGQNLFHFNQKEVTSDTHNWHQTLHQKLNFTDKQHQQLELIERKFYTRQTELEKKIKLANRQLAEAFKKEHKFSPLVDEATDQIHHHMGELQKATLEHLFEMRTILTEEQNKKLDQMVTDALQ